MGSIQNKIYKNSLVILISRILNLLAGLLIVPILINKLGVEGYGIWESIIAIATFSTVIMVSINQTLTWRMSISYGRRNIDDIKNWFSVGMFLVLLQLIVIVPIVYFTRNLIVDSFNVPSKYAHTVANILPLISGIFIINGIGEVYGSILSGLQKSGLTIVHQVVSTVLSQFLFILFIILGLGFYSLIIGYVIKSFLYFGLLKRSVNNLIPDVKISMKVINVEQIHKTYKFFALTLIGTITLLLRSQVTKILLITNLSTIAVGNFSIATRLSGLVLLVSGFFLLPTQTAVSSLFADRRLADIENVYERTTKMFVFLCGLITSLLCILIERISIVWLGFTNSEIVSFTLILLIGQSIAIMTTAIGVAVVIGIGKPHLETLYIIVNLFLNVIALIVFVKIWGGIGAIIASSTTWAFSGFIFLIIFHKYTNISFRHSVVIFKSILLNILFIYLGRQFIDFFEIKNSIIYSILFIGFSTTIIVILYYFLNNVLNILPLELRLHNLARISINFFNQTSLRNKLRKQ